MTTTVAPAGLPARRRNDLPAAVSIAAAGVVASLAAVALVARAAAWSLPATSDVPVDATIGATYSLIGALVLAAASGSRRIGWLLLSGFASALAVLATASAATATEPDTAAQLAVQLENWLWVPGFLPLVTLIPLLYPDGLLPGPRWRPVAVVAIAGIALLSLGMALYPETFEGAVAIEKPITAEVPARALVLSGALLLVPSCIASIASLFVRLRRSVGLQRRQVLVFLIAAGVVVVDLVLQSALPQPLAGISQAAAVVLLPVAIGVAITRHRLYDLDLAVCRTLVAVSLAGCLAGAYLTLFSLCRALLGDQAAIASALAAGLTGLLVQPLASRLSRAVDRMFYGDRADPYTLVARLSARLADGLAVVDVPRVVCTTVVDSLRLGSAEIRLQRGDRSRSVVTVGDVAGAQEAFELRHRGELVGQLLVTPRAGESRLDSRDLDLLGTVVGQVAPAISALRLYDQLQQSREALVAAREEERRRLRRDLHDGVGAALAGVRLQLDSARDMVADESAVRLLDAAGAGVAEAVGDVRRITDDLRPPALDELGLAGSLVALADRLRTPNLQVTAQVALLPELPAATEVACYRIASEAMANAARHSGAQSIVVGLTVNDHALSLRVSDDGKGLPAEHRPGALGLESMRQRAEETGGTCSVASGPDGTTVSAVLPR